MNKDQRKHAAINRVLHKPTSTGMKFLVKKGYIPRPSTILTGMAGLHKARLVHPNISEEGKFFSLKWLVDHGFEPTINVNNFHGEIKEWMEKYLKGQDPTA